MIASSSRAALVLFGLAGLTLGEAALAQAPVQLLPPLQGERENEPAPRLVPPFNDPAGPAASPMGAEPAAPRRTSGIRGEELRAPDANGSGLLDEARGGFGLDTWEGTNPLLVQRLMPALPNAVPSPTARSLQRRLLLSIAAPPVPPEGERQAPIPLI
jgi:hypothetical protein